MSTLPDRRDVLEDRWRREGFWQDRCVGEYIAAQVTRHPDVFTVFVDGPAREQIDNRQRLDDAELVVSALHAMGLQPGDVIAIQLTASRATAALYHACLIAGLVVLPIVTIYGEEEVTFILQQSRARALFCHDQLRSTDYRSRIPRYRLIPTLQHVVMLGEQPVAGSVGWSDFMSLACPGGAATTGTAPVSPDDTCLIVYTSGTTSRPKGVRHTHNTLLAEWARPSFAIRGPHLCSFPMGHYTGFSFLMRPLVCGTSSIFMDRWDARAAAQLIQEFGITDCGGTPYFLITLLQAAAEAGLDIRSLQNFPMGGTGISTEHVRMAQRAGFVAGRVYGSTEHPTVTYSWPDMSFAQRGESDGRIEPGNEVRILDANLRDLPAGVEGELVTRGPELFRGYIDSDLNAAAFLEGGWFRTGDLARSDEAGNLTITGRLKDIIIRGGENISALEVEDYLTEIPGIDEVAVVGMPDELLGERVVAFVEGRPRAGLTSESVIQHLLARGIARQKIPVEVRWVDSFPRTPSGKVRKQDLREALVRQQGGCPH